MLRLSIQSLWHRRATALLTVISIALSVAMVLGVERARTQARESFSSTVSGTDLIVSARGNPVQILLSSVFHLGYPTNNLSWTSYQTIAKNPAVAWTIPLVIGDSHKGFRAIGTTPDLFEHFQYGRRQGLSFAEGKAFADKLDTVIGAEVADRLNYKLGQKLVVAHGAGEISFVEHKTSPFTVVGILARTGTPVDRAIYITLEGYEGMHEGFGGGFGGDQRSDDPLMSQDTQHEDRTISAFLVGLRSRQDALGMERLVNEFPGEPLTAILPAPTLLDLWEVTAVAETALLVVSSFVVVVGLFGMLTNLLASLNERRREMAVLRSVGARPSQILALIVGEASVLTLAGILVGIGLLSAIILVVQPIAAAKYGFSISLSAFSAGEWMRVGAVWLAGTLVGLVPAIRSYQSSLADGLSIRL
ncbi:MAG: ABC transporter permease [Fimbriimonas sp.]